MAGSGPAMTAIVSLVGAAVMSPLFTDLTYS